MPPSGKKKKNKPSRDHFDDDAPRGLWKLVRLFLLLGLWCGIILGIVIAWYAAELPHIVQSTAFHRKSSVVIRAADGSVVARYGDLKGDTVEVDDLPPEMIHAVVAIEDRRFYHHFGIDPFGLLRAVAANVRQHDVVQGGSTVTQQLAKNLFLTQDRTLRRKIQEALLAVWLEYQLSKDEILTAYLNRVYLGSGAYGVEAASDIYFGKHAHDLTLQESAILAGLLKAPSRYSPLASPDQAKARARIVLNAMLEEKYITAKQYKAAVAADLPVPQHKPLARNTERYFGDWIMSELVAKIGPPDRDLIVETTLWPGAQKTVQAAVDEELATLGAKKNASQSAVVLMDITGAVRAMVGGLDYNKSQFNRATQSLRQPGSSFKPVVYLTALENGWHPNDMIFDSPVSIGRYRPANFKNEYFGEVPLHFALSRSLNSAAIQLAQSVGVAKIVDMAHNLGIRAPLEKNLSLALGSNGVPVIEMVTAYATIANGGVGVDPYAIASIKDTDGKVLYQYRAKAMPLQVVSYRAVNELAGMMKETIDEGTGRRAAIPYLAAGKTGTSQDYRDAWFMGFSGRFAAGVWVGNDDNSKMKAVTGGSLPADIWKQVMVSAYNEAQAMGVSTQGKLNFGNPFMNGDPDGVYNPESDQQFIGTDAAPPPVQPEAEQRSFGDVLRSLF